MKGRVLFSILLLVVAFLLTPSIENISEALEDGPPRESAIRSVEERRVLAAIDEQRDRLREKEEILQQRELELKTLEREVDKKMDELRTAREEAAALLEKKNEVESKRLRDLSAMYEKMAPEKAAALLANMEEGLAVDILAGMKSKTAGRVLGNMERDKAARLSRAYSKL
jgi:flagellar motility protein MotE (MotC chaperone)